MITAEQLVKRVGEVADAIAFQSGTGGVEIAGTIMSCLWRKPELIDEFMNEGSELFIDGRISVGRGQLSYHARDGSVQPASKAAVCDTVREIKRNATSQ